MLPVSLVSIGVTDGIRPQVRKDAFLQFMTDW